MIVLDTHVWLWWNSEPDKLSPTAAAAIEGTEEIGVCPISCWELSMKVARGRLILDRQIQAWVDRSLSRPRVRLLPITAQIAVIAGQIDRRSFHGDPADRLIVATALAHAADLVTKDQKIRASSHVKSLW